MSRPNGTPARSVDRARRRRRRAVPGGPHVSMISQANAATGARRRGGTRDGGERAVAPGAVARRRDADAGIAGSPPPSPFARASVVSPRLVLIFLFLFRQRRFPRRARAASGAASWAVWRPTPPAGYASLGDCVSFGGDKPPTEPVLVIRDSPAFTAAPVRFERVALPDAAIANGVADGLALWRPVPPPGFVSLGLVATSIRAGDHQTADANGVKDEDQTRHNPRCDHPHGLPNPPPADCVRCVRVELARVDGVYGRVCAGGGDPPAWMAGATKRERSWRGAHWRRARRRPPRLGPPLGRWPRVLTFDRRRGFRTMFPGHPALQIRRTSTPTRPIKAEPDTARRSDARPEGFRRVREEGFRRRRPATATVVEFTRAWWISTAAPLPTVRLAADGPPACLPGRRRRRRAAAAASTVVVQMRRVDRRRRRDSNPRPPWRGRELGDGVARRVGEKKARTISF